MSKRDVLVFRAPVANVAGYGAHGRDLLKSLKDMDRFDIKVLPSDWGDTPKNALKPETNDFHQWIMDNLVEGQLSRQPEIWIDVTVPNEFRKVGKFNIGITAGIETTACSHDWVEGMNRMDLNIVPSEFSKKVFEDTVYDQRDQAGNKIGESRVNTPIEVLFEGYDKEVYGPDVEPVNDLEFFNKELDKIKEKFCFLFVGHWLKGDFGHDRKDVATLIKTFGEAFATKGDKPALVLKTSHATFSYIDRQQTQRKIDRIREMIGANCPPIYLLHGDLTDEEMNQLYNHPKMKAMVSFTKGEGFGRPLLEFSLTGKPVIATKWSGHVDFLDENHSVLLDGRLGKVHPSAQWENVIIEGSQWFYVDWKKGKEVLRDVHKNYKKYLKNSKKQGKINRENFSLEKMTEKFEEILDNHLPKFPKQMDVKLPNLPKLERVEDG